MAPCQINETWSVAGSYSRMRWELTDSASLGVPNADLIQIGMQARLTDNISAGFGFVWSTSDGWSGGATPPANLSYPVIGVNFTF